MSIVGAVRRLEFLSWSPPFNSSFFKKEIEIEARFCPRLEPRAGVILLFCCCAIALTYLGVKREWNLCDNLSKREFLVRYCYFWSSDGKTKGTKKGKLIQGNIIKPPKNSSFFLRISLKHKTEETPHSSKTTLCTANLYTHSAERWLCPFPWLTTIRSSF